MIRQPVACERCGVEADVDWIDVCTFTDSEPVYVMGRSACRTPGCVDEHGSVAVMPPDEPGSLTREDRKWLRRQRALADEYGRVARLLDAEVSNF